MKKRKTMEGLDAIKYLNKDIGLLDKQILEIRIYKLDDKLHVELIIDLTDSSVNVNFVDVKEISFYYNEKFIFYCIDRYKLFYNESKDEYYLSLDPYDENAIENSNDQDIIRAKSVIVEHGK